MVANGNLINRPLNLLFPIECPRNDITKDTEMKDSAQSSDIDESVLEKTLRPPRQAAIKARANIQECLNPPDDENFLVWECRGEHEI